MPEYTTVPMAVTTLPACPVPGYAYRVGGKGIDTHVALVVKPADAQLFTVAHELVTELEHSLAWIAKVAADQPEGDPTGLAARAMRQYRRTEDLLKKAKGEK